MKKGGVYPLFPQLKIVINYILSYGYTAKEMLAMREDQKAKKGGPDMARYYDGRRYRDNAAEVYNGGFKRFEHLRTEHFKNSDSKSDDKENAGSSNDNGNGWYNQWSSEEWRVWREERDKPKPETKNLKKEKKEKKAQKMAKLIMASMQDSSSSDEN